MKMLDRYIMKSVLFSMIVVTVIIISVDLVLSLADELPGSDGNYSMLNALWFVVQTTPTSIYELLPFSALGGALIGLGVLASNNELVVMQAAGIQTWRIVWSVMKPTLGVMILSLVLGEYIAPGLEQVAQSNKALQQSGEDTINSDQGNWRKIGNEFIHINAIAPGGESLFGITRYEVDDSRQIVASSFAESARYISATERTASYWRLGNVRKTRIEPGNLTAENYPQEDWQIDLSPELLSVLLVDPDRQSISGLYRFAQFFVAEGLDARAYFLAFWKKLLQPLSTAALVLLAISFVFGPLREATIGFRVFVAIGIGLGFTIVQRVMEPASLIYGLSPLFAVILPILLCFGMGAYFMQKVR